MGLLDLCKKFLGFAKDSSVGNRCSSRSFVLQCIHSVHRVVCSHTSWLLADLLRLVVLQEICYREQVPQHVYNSWGLCLSAFPGRPAILRFVAISAWSVQRCLAGYKARVSCSAQQHDVHQNGRLRLGMTWDLMGPAQKWPEGCEPATASGMFHILLDTAAWVRPTTVQWPGHSAAFGETGTVDFR